MRRYSQDVRLAAIVSKSRAIHCRKAGQPSTTQQRNRIEHARLQFGKPAVGINEWQVFGSQVAVEVVEAWLWCRGGVCGGKVVVVTVAVR